MIRGADVVLHESCFRWQEYDDHGGRVLVAGVSAPPPDYPERIYGSLPTGSDALVVTRGKTRASAETKRLKTICSLSRITPVSLSWPRNEAGYAYKAHTFDRRDSLVEGAYLVRDVLFEFSPGPHRGMVSDLVQKMREYAAGKAIDWSAVDKLDGRDLLDPDDDPPEWTIIYALLDPDGSIRYIGKTFVSLEARLKQHIREAKSQTNPHDVWIAGLPCAPKIVMLKTVPTSEWKTEERHFVRGYYHVLGARLTNTEYLYERCPHGCDWAAYRSAVVQQWDFVKLQGEQLLCTRSHAVESGWMVWNTPDVTCDVLEVDILGDSDILLLTREKNGEDGGRIYAISRLSPVFAPSKFESLPPTRDNENPAVPTWRYDDSRRAHRSRGGRLDGNYMVRGILLDAKGTRTLGDKPLISEMTSLMRAYAAGNKVDWANIGDSFRHRDPESSIGFGIEYDAHLLHGL